MDESLNPKISDTGVLHFQPNMNFVANSFNPIPETFQSSINGVGNQQTNPNVPFSSVPSQSNQAFLPNGQHIWCQNVPNVMPWTYPTASPHQNQTYSFSSYQNANLYNGIQNGQPMGCYQQYFHNSDQPYVQINTPPVINNSFLNKNNKRHMNVLDDDVDTEFDFENQRPLKKYICDDKVLEIFDKLHIREGDHYIVEDVVEKDHPSMKNINKHNVVIEELENETSNDYVLELSPELKNAFQNNQSITDKLYNAEKEKHSKAVVLWQPNQIKNLLNSVHDNQEENDSVDAEIKIEEALSDEDEEMDDVECDQKIIIQPIVEGNDVLSQDSIIEPLIDQNFDQWMD